MTTTLFDADLIDACRAKLNRLHPSIPAAKWDVVRIKAVDADNARLHGFELVGLEVVTLLRLEVEKEARSDTGASANASKGKVGALLVLDGDDIIGTFIIMADIGLSLVSAWNSDLLEPFQRVTLEPRQSTSN